LIEAPRFELPVVNIGNRQRGRVQAPNVIQASNSREEIAAAISQALTTEFRQKLQGIKNPYGTGSASSVIVSRLKTINLERSEIIIKRFYNKE